jgi:hypothetical protein
MVASAQPVCQKVAPRIIGLACARMLARLADAPPRSTQTRLPPSSSPRA